MTNRFKALLFLLLLVAVTAHPASAITVLGDPFFDSSWGVRMVQSSTEKWGNNVAVGHYDYMRIDIVAGDDYGSLFEPPAIRNISNGAWSRHSSTSYFGDLYGPSGTYPQFDMVFYGDPVSGGTRIHYACYRGSELRMAQLVYFNGSGNWVQSVNLTQEQWDPGVVPEPTTLVLLGVCLAGPALAGLVRRRRGRASA